MRRLSTLYERAFYFIPSRFLSPLFNCFYSAYMLKYLYGFYVKRRGGYRRAYDIVNNRKTLRQYPPR